MYTPQHFAEPRVEEIERIVREHPLGLLITPGDPTVGADRVAEVNHIPFEFESAGPDKPARLLAHVARANPVWQRNACGTPVLVVFRGDHSYVSPNSYPSKHETHRQVPTWNYQVVHVRGVLTVREDEKFLRAVVGRLTQRHERPEAQPWKMSDAAPGYLEEMLRAIVGLEITVTGIESKSKLGQNKEARDRLGAADAVQARGAVELAQAMRAVGAPSKGG